MDKLQSVVEEAESRFWQFVAESYPEVKTGDFPPDATFAFDHACERAVQVWLDSNPVETPKLKLDCELCCRAIVVENPATEPEILQITWGQDLTDLLDEEVNYDGHFIEVSIAHGFSYGGQAMVDICLECLKTENNLPMFLEDGRSDYPDDQDLECIFEAYRAHLLGWS